MEMQPVVLVEEETKLMTLVIQAHVIQRNIAKLMVLVLNVTLMANG